MVPSLFCGAKRNLACLEFQIMGRTTGGGLGGASKAISCMERPITWIIFLHFISGGKSWRKLIKKIPYRLPQNWLGGRLFHYTAFWVTFFWLSLQKVFIAVNHMCAFTSRSEMKHLTQGLCSSNALTFPKCSTNRSKNNSFITMPFHLGKKSVKDFWMAYL